MEVQEELEKFKHELISHDADLLKKRIYTLETTIEEMNNELIYLRKRTTEDILEIRKFTIENHELKKRNDLLEQEDKNKGREEEKHAEFGHKRQMSEEKLDMDELKKLKEKNKYVSE